MSARLELDARTIRHLLDVLDARLRERGVAATVFIVGGAALAVKGIRPGRSTVDIDALTRDARVIVEARQMAEELSLPATWFNDNATMWMPPLPSELLEPPATPGLRVVLADDEFLLATKLVAQRARDVDDIRALARCCGLVTPNPDQLERLIRSHYRDEGALALIVGGDPNVETRLLAKDAARMLASTR